MTTRRLFHEGDTVDIYRRMVKDVADALRYRDQRAARIIKEHRESDVCRDNCWTTITNQILGKDGNKDAT